MEDYLLKAKRISKEILNLLYAKPGLFHNELCGILCIAPQGLSNALKKLVQEGLVEENRKGKYKYYFLSEEVQRNFEPTKEYKERAKKERSQDALYKTLFSNIINGLSNNVYASYFSKDMEFTFAYFSVTELMMLLFILGIYNYGEGQNFASIFGVDEVSAIEIEKNLLTKFQTFLFEVIQKYNIPLAEENKER